MAVSIAVSQQGSNSSRRKRIWKPYFHLQKIVSGDGDGVGLDVEFVSEEPRKDECKSWHGTSLITKPRQFTIYDLLKLAFA